LDPATGAGNEPASLEWLEDALKHAHAQGRPRTLAYLEAVMEDAVFEAQMAAARRAFAGG
jgi:hypothetical protein